jgi:hypothetical protein
MVCQHRVAPVLEPGRRSRGKPPESGCHHQQTFLDCVPPLREAAPPAKDKDTPSIPYIHVNKNPILYTRIRNRIKTATPLDCPNISIIMPAAGFLSFGGQQQTLPTSNRRNETTISVGKGTLSDQKARNIETNGRSTEITNITTHGPRAAKSALFILLPITEAKKVNSRRCPTL